MSPRVSACPVCAADWGAIPSARQANHRWLIRCPRCDVLLLEDSVSIYVAFDADIVGKTLDDPPAIR